MNADEAFELYEEGARAHGRGDLDATIDAWQRLFELYFERGAVDAIDTKRATVPKTMLLSNLAIVCQKVKRWPQMHRFAELVVDEARTAGNLRLLATALKNDGESDRARAIIEEAVRADPGHANSHHEHACILAAAGELTAALQAMQAAVAAGAKPQSLLDDDELAMMRDVPGFERVFGPQPREPYDDLDFD